MELQLRVLRFYLVTDTSLVNFTFRPKDSKTVNKRTQDEQRGQDMISLAILRTNRLYRAQGLRILWQENNFLYNEHKSAREKKIAFGNTTWSAHGNTLPLDIKADQSRR